jgi:hypothetical protein
MPMLCGIPNLRRGLGLGAGGPNKYIYYNISIIILYCTPHLVPVKYPVRHNTGTAKYYILFEKNI